MEFKTCGLAIVLLCALGIMATLYVGTLRELERERKISAEMYELLTPDKKRQIEQAWEARADILNSRPDSGSE